jgi:nucleotide-binding universal stress UspA family protein
MEAMTDIFDNVVCAVDDSEAGELAARIAARLTRPEGALALVSVENVDLAVHAGWKMAAVSAEIAREARAALERGREAAGPVHEVEERLVRGEPVDRLLAELHEREATAVVVGTHGLSRPVGIALGSVTTTMLHEAPCSVVVARANRQPERWPRSIVVGVDGSPESRAAVEAARGLAERFGATLREVVALDGEVDLDAANGVSPDLEMLSGKPVEELSVLSEFTDLVVVGSRGLKGLRALGSVSERVAHEARCPVLVVRPR